MRNKTKQNKTNKYIILFFLILTILPLSFYGMRFFSKEFVSENGYPEIAKRLENHVKQLSYNIGNLDDRHPENLKKAASYIEQEFISYGYEVKRQKYQTNGVDVENIIASKNLDISEEIIVIGAHYDTMDNPGADDNASGVAGVLELSRIIANTKTAEKIEFVAFVNEEPPYFKTDKMGSHIYVEKLKNENRKIKHAIILEMIGYYKDTYFSQQYPGILGFFFPNKGNFIALVGNSGSSEITKDMKKVILENTNIPVEKISFDFTARFLDYSDHGPFWLSGMKAIMVTDTAFFRNMNYHKQTDTYDTLDYERMSELVIGIRDYLDLNNNK